MYSKLIHTLTPLWGGIDWRRFLRYNENLLVTLALAAMVLIPLVEILLRKAFQIGISGATSIVQHLVLVAGILGSALAAREGRLLALSTFTTFLKGRWKSAAQIFSSSFAIAICVMLTVASFQYLMITIEAGKILAYGVPIWIVQSVMPMGFGVVSFRLFWRASENWKGRLLSLLIAGSIVGIGIFPPIAPSNMVVFAIIILFIATILGAPIFTTLGGAALILFWGQESPIASLAIDHYRMVVNPSLAAIPLFTLAGYFLAEGGASKRLIRVFQALIGQVRGGPAIISVLVCAFFTSFTGASGVTILALGGLLMPVLRAAKYSERNSIGILTGAGSLGLLFAPCLPLILYAIIASNIGAGITIQQMFLGGLIPGLLLVALTAIWGIVQEPKKEKTQSRFNWVEAGSAIWIAKWELLLPVVALVSLFGGFATPVEASAVTALYAFIVETIIHRDLKIIKDIPRVMTECGLIVGGVLLILGVAMGFTNYLIDAQIPDIIVEWVKSNIQSPLVFLLVLNIFLLIVGCLMDIFSAIIVVVPLIVPIGLAYGIDPVHLGIIFLANMELGYLTPPVGMNLFLSSYRFGKPVLTVARSIIPMFIVLLVGVLLITYIPPLTTALPALFKSM